MAISLAMTTLNATLPDNAIMVEEAITAGPDFARSIDISGPGAYYAGRGGGIGQGLAGALGVAVANPDKPTVCVSGDGSAMYSIQALWTAAHHDLPIVFVILANREYRVLKHNIDAYRGRFNVESNRGYTHMDLRVPNLASRKSHEAWAWRPSKCQNQRTLPQPLSAPSHQRSQR